MELEDRIMIESFCTYLPEAHGFRAGSNNGNYTQYTTLKAENGKYYVKYESSGDGDVFPWPEWEGITFEEFVNILSSAAWDAGKQEGLLEEKGRG